MDCCAKPHRLDFEERSGKLLQHDEVERAAFNTARTIRDGKLNIPDRVAGLLTAESDEREVH